MTPSIADDFEKPQVANLDNPQAKGFEDQDIVLPPDFAAREKKLVRKLDLHILPVLVLLYVMSFLDRVNIGKSIETKTPWWKYGIFDWKSTCSPDM